MYELLEADWGNPNNLEASKPGRRCVICGRAIKAKEASGFVRFYQEQGENGYLHNEDIRAGEEFEIGATCLKKFEPEYIAYRH